MQAIHTHIADIELLDFLSDYTKRPVSTTDREMKAIRA